MTGGFPAGFPHSDISGSMDICSSPKLFAAYHVFHRLLVPRHPPCALISLTNWFSSAGADYSSTVHSVAPLVLGSLSLTSCLFGYVLRRNTSDVLIFSLNIRYSICSFQGTWLTDILSAIREFNPWTLWSLVKTSFILCTISLFSDLAATYSPAPSPVKYHRPLRS